MNDYGVPVKDSAGQPVTFSYNVSNGRPVAKFFVVCNQKDTAPIWGYILRQRGMAVILETSLEKAIDRWSVETPDLVIIDLDVEHEKRMELYQKFREVSIAPILLLLPAYHETQMLEAYAAGVDDVIVKPISPAVFLAKILAWSRRGASMPVSVLSLVKAGNHRLDPRRRCLTSPDGSEIPLTTLEFRLLHLLMSQPEQVFSAEELIPSIWGAYGSGDQVLLKNVVYRLRKKIEADPSHPVLLQTWHGGYSFHR